MSFLHNVSSVSEEEEILKICLSVVGTITEGRKNITVIISPNYFPGFAGNIFMCDAIVDRYHHEHRGDY